MASIIEVKGKWRALVRRTGHKAQCKTFPTRRQAEAWAAQRERDLDTGAATAANSVKFTVAQVIRAYRTLRDMSRPISDKSNEHYMLKNLERGLGPIRLDRMCPQDLVAYCTQRKDEGAGPYTCNMEVSKLGTALRYGGVQLGAVMPDVVGAARPLLTHLRLIGSGGKRERRPTPDEVERILEHMERTYGSLYAQVVEFAMHSAMRRGEISALAFEDLDPDTHTVRVWRKHPRQGKKLHVVPLLGRAWEMVQARPRGEPEPVTRLTERGEVTQMLTRVFPVHVSTTSKYFTWTCRDLGIPDLHLHDMRHEGASRLLEGGLEIQQAALVTGHSDWKQLRRYANLRPEDLTRDQVTAARKSSKA